MMIFPKFKDGDALTPAHMNAVFAELNRWRQMRGYGLVQVDYADSICPPQVGFFGDTGSQIQLAITDGTITARSGATAGSGNVFLVTDSLSGTTVTLTTTSTVQAVFNYSGTAGGIPTGKYCVIEQSPAGNWFIVSVEC